MFCKSSSILTSIFTITALLLVGCKSSGAPSQLVSGHTENDSGQSSNDDDLEDHCFQQEIPGTETKARVPKKTIVLNLSVPPASVDPTKVSIINLNQAGETLQFSNVGHLEIHKVPLSDTQTQLRISDKGGIILNNHLGPGPYMAVIPTTGTGINSRSGEDSSKLFYYYETYATNLSECAKYRPDKILLNTK